MNRRAIVGRVALCLIVLLPATALAQSQDEVVYFHTDAIGSVRATTDANGQMIGTYDYLPFGQSNPGQTAPAEPRRFTSQERDASTSLDYFASRYYGASTGRFSSPDLITADAIRMVDPQRWNRYAYASNNALRFNDPDGLDAILVNYTDGAHGAGHIGIASVGSNGSLFYGGFNPVHPGNPRDAGVVRTLDRPAGFMKWDSSGKPSQAVLSELKRLLAGVDGHDVNSVRIRYVKLSEAQTLRLKTFLNNEVLLQRQYRVGITDCLTMCIRGFRSAGVNVPDRAGLTNLPNQYFDSIFLEWALQEQERDTSQAPHPNVDTSETYCIPGLTCR